MKKLFIIIFICLLSISVFSASQIQIRRDTNTNWASANPTLAQGELGINLTTNAFKIGDGTTAWNSLAYYSTSGDLSSYLLKADYNTYGDLRYYLNTNPSGFITSAGLTSYLLKTDFNTYGDQRYYKLTNDSNYQTYTNLNNLVLTKGYITDAPNDGNQYARKNLGWSIVTSSGADTNCLLYGSCATLVYKADFNTLGDQRYYLNTNPSNYISTISGLNISTLTNDSNYQTYLDVNQLINNSSGSGIQVGDNVSLLTNDSNYQTYLNVLNALNPYALIGANLSTFVNDLNFQTYANVIGLLANYVPIGGNITNFNNNAGYITSYLDTNFQTAGYTAGQILLDTNAQTACADNEYLRGDGTCQVLSLTTVVDTNDQTAGYRNSSGVFLVDQNLGSKNITDVNTLTIQRVNIGSTGYIRIDGTSIVIGTN